MKRFLLHVACTAGLLGLAVHPARAGLIDAPNAQWSYTFTPSTPFISADTTQSNPHPGSVTFTSDSNSPTGNSTVDMANLRISSTALPTSPEMLTNNGAWTINMKLTDVASGASTNLTFSGKLGGSFSSQNSNVTNMFTGATTATWTAPNGNVYTVNLTGQGTGFTPPGPPDPTKPGSSVVYGAIAAYVTVQQSDGSGHTSATPEPSTLVLSFLGLAFAGATSWRKRRRTPAMVLA